MLIPYLLLLLHFNFFFMTKKILFLLLLLLPIAAVFGQTHVSGKVIDENGLPVPYANVLFPKTTIGGYTDEEGRFSLYSEKKTTRIRRFRS